MGAERREVFGKNIPAGARKQFPVPMVQGCLEPLEAVFGTWHAGCSETRMNVGLYRGTAALEVAERRLEMVTTNLANVATPGFKRHLSSHQGQLTGTSGDHYSVSTKERVDFSQGQIASTGAALDLALDGDGFFEVEGPDGPLYTRNGRMRLSPEGTMTTGSGFPVAWASGGGVLNPTGEAILVGSDGSVTQGSKRVGRISVVSFPAQDRLQLTRGGYFAASPSLRRDPSTAMVHQGSIENSNADGISELVAMVAIQRTHESASKVMEMINQSYRRLHQAR